MYAFCTVKDNELLRVRSNIGIAADDVALQAFALVVPPEHSMFISSTLYARY